MLVAFWWLGYNYGVACGCVQCLYSVMLLHCLCFASGCLSLFCSEDNEYLMFVYIMAGMLFVTALAVSMLSFLS